MTLYSTLVAVLLLSASNVHSAAFRGVGANSPGCERLNGEQICIAVALEGDIEDGDSQRLSTLISKVEAAVPKSRVGIIFLESAGGSVNEGIALGRFIRSRQIGTIIGKGEVCASACVLVLAGGVTRMPAGEVVVHSFYSPSILGTGDFKKSEQEYTRVSELIRSYLLEVRVSAMLLEEMMRIPHTSFRKLEVEELVKLGLLGIDPAYAQARKLPK